MSRARGDELVVVAIGGALGALARYGIAVLVPRPDTVAWPWATFVTNLLGCLVLGVVLEVVDSRHDRWLATSPSRARLTRPLLASGVLGGFTTTSALSLEVVGMLRGGDVPVAMVYAASSVVLGVLLVLVGRLLGARLAGAAPIRLEEDEDL